MRTLHLISSAKRLTGALGEALARNYLRKCGYTIWESNWKHRHGELDIIALYQNTLVICEVKTRVLSHRSPLYTITQEKESRLEHLAELFIKRKDKYLLSSAIKQLSIDYIGVSFLPIGKSDLISIVHLKSAYTRTL